MSTEVDSPDGESTSVDIVSNFKKQSKMDWRLLSADLVLKIAAFVPLRWIPSMSSACRAFCAACDDETICQALCKAQVLKSTLNSEFMQ